MTGITSSMIGAVIMASIAAPMIQLNVQQAKGRANMEARLLYQAEVDRAKKIWSTDNVDFDKRELYNTKYCKKLDGYGYDDEGFNFKVSCSTGKQTVGGKDLLLAFPALERNPGQFTDEDQNGFEDVTGLPTHDDSCYEGWKGDGFRNRACALGGNNVIPMYENIYKSKRFSGYGSY